ncbi:MAG: alpha/beta hydrolase [Nanoarchaeota archaeon]|nr:alpha/beta hydrolase [Nanoarchaeota archaeon]
MEEKIQIPTKDDHIIYGILNYQRKKSDELIVFVHGLNGSQNDHQFYNAARFFSKTDFTTFRFNQYSGEKKGRTLTDCTTKMHAEDLNTVVNFFDDKFQEIYLVGHSLGGSVILLSDLEKVKSVVLWEPSIQLRKVKDKLTYNKELDVYVLSWSIEYLISKQMFEEWKYLDSRLVEKITRPTKIICADQGRLKDNWKKIVDKIQVPYEFMILKGAGHCFDEEGAEEALFDETLKWIQK